MVMDKVEDIRGKEESEAGGTKGGR